MYRFRVLDDRFKEAKCDEVASRMMSQYAKLTKSWNQDMNSEWLCRVYFAAKLVMAATTHVNALDYSVTKNLRVVSPYLRYYAVFSALRAVYMTMPEIQWRDGEIISASHSAVIRDVLQYVSSFDICVAESLKSDIRKLKAARELLSYKAPSSGDGEIGSVPSTVDVCTLLCEIAQFNSELLEASVNKNADSSMFVLKPDFIERIAFVEIEGELFGDNADEWRLIKFARRETQVANLMLMMSEGHVDDFFGAWQGEEDIEGCFDPDFNNQVIFDIP